MKKKELKETTYCDHCGIKAILGHFKTDAEAKKAAEKAVAHWLSTLPHSPRSAAEGGTWS